jgi:hypothetical protein
VIQKKYFTFGGTAARQSSFAPAMQGELFSNPQYA